MSSCNRYCDLDRKVSVPIIIIISGEVFGYKVEGKTMQALKRKSLNIVGSNLNDNKKYSTHLLKDLLKEKSTVQNEKVLQSLCFELQRRVSTEISIVSCPLSRYL